MTPACHWTPDHGWLTPEHQRDCNTTSCAGCKPCPEDHCALRGRCPHHVNHAAGLWTCPACIGRTRKDLAAIVELYALADTAVEQRRGTSALLVEVAQNGVDSEAFNLVGPVADPAQLEARRAYTDDHRGVCDYPRTLDRHHPFALLARWENDLRDTYGMPTDLFTTVTRAVDFLVTLLAGPFPHGPDFEAFARDLATCRTHLEDVLHDSRTPEEGRHCPRCTETHGKGPRLRKRYAQHPGLKAGEICIHERCATCAGVHDTWHCPDDSQHWWTEHDYRDRVAVDYVEHADQLPARELAERLGVPLSRIRKLAARQWDEQARTWHDPQLASRRRGVDGRKLYSVADAARILGSVTMTSRPSA